MHAAQVGTTAPVRLLPRGAAFTAVVVVEIGGNVMEVVDVSELFVFVRNRSRSRTLLHARESRSMDPRRASSTETVTIPFDGGWVAHEGDVLDVCATPQR
ncbi:hypothetical protein [Pseudonocardia humida]|uniref:Uncharacterized protein n=1 Tax=Pseudonocardia humida TaxID=2800819 RepID=A0ABT0ZY08_9PSEU|nr:hypothetical protein [Pseudonocardia humida]MCO1655630.1 hypothetical protein [Pseudonocardia humida]